MQCSQSIFAMLNDRIGYSSGMSPLLRSTHPRGILPTARRNGTRSLAGVTVSYTYPICKPTPGSGFSDSFSSMPTIYPNRKQVNGYTCGEFPPPGPLKNQQIPVPNNRCQ